MNNRERIDIPDSGFNKAMGEILKEKRESSELDEIVSFEESLYLAKELLVKYQKQIEKNLYEDVDGWGEDYESCYQNSIGHFLEEVPEELLERFDGHGMTKNSEINRLAGALNVLANKAIKGECGHLKSRHIPAYTHGDFLIVSKIDKGLPITHIKDSRKQPIFNKIGWTADIGAFVVNTHYYPIVEELKKKFPDVNIIRANELKEYLLQEEKNSMINKK